jgi:teichuronic acid exporter
MVNQKRSDKHIILSSLVWKLMERLGSKGVGFIVQLLLARLLLPSDYGIVALVLVFIEIASVFVQSGIGTSLIQKKELDEEDITSLFYLTIAIALFLYLIFYFSAPLIASFYENRVLIKITRVLAFSLIINAFSTIQTALLSKEMKFKTLFIVNIISSTISGVIGVSLAIAGYGPWALVIQQIVRTFGVALLLSINVKWRPKLLFSFPKVKKLYSFAWKITLSSLVFQIYSSLVSLIIGKKFSPENLAYYNRGGTFPLFVTSNITGAIQSVLFPALAAKQDSIPQIKKMTRRSIITTSFLVFPMMVGLVVVAKPLVIIILTEKWLEVVPFIQLLSLCYWVNPILIANLQAFNALGRSDLHLKVETTRYVVGFAIIFGCSFFGLWALVIGEVVVHFLSYFIYIYPNGKLIDYGIKEQTLDILPSVILAVAMGIVTYLVTFLRLSNLLTLTIQVVLGVSFYFGVAYLLKMERFIYLIEAVFPKKESKILP